MRILLTSGIKFTVIHDIFETNSEHYGKSSISVFQKIFASTDKIVISGGGLSTRQQLYEVFEIFLIFPNFLRSQVLNRSATRVATHI